MDLEFGIRFVLISSDLVLWSVYEVKLKRVCIYREREREWRRVVKGEKEDWVASTQSLASV